jgi:hypothetical protein
MFRDNLPVPSSRTMLESVDRELVTNVSGQPTSAFFKSYVSVDRELVTNISGQPTSPFFKSCVSQRRLRVNCQRFGATYRYHHQGLC